MLLPARSTPSKTTKVPRGGGFEAATADMVRKRLKIVLAARFPRLRLLQGQKALENRLGCRSEGAMRVLWQREFEKVEIASVSYRR